MPDTIICGNFDVKKLRVLNTIHGLWIQNLAFPTEMAGNRCNSAVVCCEKLR